MNETNERGVPPELVDRVEAARVAGFASVCVVCGHGLGEDGVGDHFTGCKFSLVELARAATRGPWRWGRGEADWQETTLVTVEKRERWSHGDQAPHETVVLNEDSPWDPRNAADRAYIAAASEKIIALAAEDAFGRLSTSHRGRGAVTEGERRTALAHASYVLDWLRATDAPRNVVALQTKTVEMLGGEGEGRDLRGVPAAAFFSPAALSGQA